MIVLFWLVMVGLLLRREVLLPRLASLSLANPALSETTNTSMGVYLDSRQVGVVNVRTNPAIRDGKEGVAIGLYTRMRLDMLGEDNELFVTGNAWFVRGEGVSDFSFDLRSGEHVTTVKAAVEGKVLNAVVKSGGEEFPVKWPIKDNVVLWNSMGTSTLNVPAMRKGQQYLVDTFDPLSMSVAQARVTYIGDESIAIEGKPITARVVTSDISGITSKAWVTDRGEVVKAETPLGFTLQRISEEEARSRTLAGGGASSLLERVAVVPKGPHPTRGALQMLVRVGGVPAGVPIPTDETQVATGANAFSIKPPISEQGLDNAPQPGKDFEEFLTADPFVQSTHPRIVEQAKAIVGNEPRLWRRAKLINDWVYKNIDKKAVLSLPSALDVLTTKEGDCNEHTVLFAALARSVGIPTRIAIGIVWSDEYKGFYYHAWPEVYVGRWVWMDPTFGQPVADATHIKLLNGSIDKWWQVARFVGKLQIELVESG